MPDHIHVEINTGTILKVILTILFFVFLYILKDVLIIFFFAIIIASAISPFANWLDKKGFPRLLGVLLLFLVVLALIIALLSLIIPYVSQDISQLTSTLPQFVTKVSTSLEKVQQGSPQYLDFLSEIQNMLQGFSDYLQQSSQSVLGLVISIFGGVMSAIAILIISFYLSVTKNGIENFLGAIVPEKYESYAIDLWKRAELKVGLWLQGQLLLGLVMGLLVYVGLSLMGIKFALILGFLAAIFEIVPIVGPVLAAIPAIFLAFLQSPALGLWVIVFYIVIQQLENHLLVPVVLGKTIGLNPVVVIIALLIGQNLAGIPGMILSVPVATIIVEMMDDFAKHKDSKRASM
ncbi:MAG: AI-2E family transporter [Candidatus Yanofskybacteria bacterium]|nr:AI-2E family transporter [Candidatus Yanofskybacteria bacterium]